MKTKFIAAIVATWVWCSGLLCSCISEPLVPGGSDSGDGTLTPVTLSIQSDSFRDSPSRSGEPFCGDTRTEADESTIGCLHLLVFDSNGDAVLNEQFDNLTATDGTYRLQTQTMPGNGMQFYAIANPDITGYLVENLPNQLSAVTTLKGLNELLSTLKADTDGWQPTGRMLMTGHVTINVTKPSGADIPLTLGFLSSKVTVTLLDKTDDKLDIDITGWDMVNVPCKTYLLEQTGKDAVTGTKPEDYLTTASKFAFESVDKEAKSWAQTCYLLENRRGGRVDRADPTNAADKYPGMSVSDTNQRGKAWYAPAGATYLLVYGTHTQNGQTNNILYKIYLGGNAVNDYNLARGKHYQYNVSINGLNDIDIDTNVEWGASSFTVDQSDNLTMDAHPDVRVLRIGGTATDADTPAYATVEVLDQSGTSPGTWLAVSPLNLYRHAIKQTGSAANNQQFAAMDGVGSYVRTRYTPTPTAVEKFADATFGMTRKLTKIPFAQVAVCSYQEVLLYADAYGGSGDRTGQVRITYYKGVSGTEVAGQQTLTVVQSGALQVSADLYVERYEEAAMKLHPGLDEALQRSSTMQWGYNTSALYDATDRFCNGNFLTANAVYTNVATRHAMDAPQWLATDYAHYRTKYPAMGAAVNEPSGVSTSGTPYYYPELTQTMLPASYFHPIYNSSAARYCHEKNRDLNGDGVIDASETVWYLPSYADMVAIKKNATATQSLTGTYWTSSEEGADKCWAFTFPQGTTAAADKTTPYRVRCVRGAGVLMTEATIESENEDNTKISLPRSMGANGVFNIVDDKNFSAWTVTSGAPEWLKIATDAKGTEPTTTKTGTGDATFYVYAVTANETTAARTATLTLTRPEMATNPKKEIEVTQEKVPLSNCYILPPGAAIHIPVERANESYIELTGSIYNSITKTYHQLQASTTWTASLVWESSVGLISLSQKAGTGPSGAFKVTANNASTQGNAVVAIKNANNEVLWSWHIWVTTYDGSTHFTTNNGDRNFIFMDRSLGATSITPGELGTNGLLYEWGRKDPFPGIGQKGGSWSVSDSTDPILVYNALGTAYTIFKEKVPTSIVLSNSLSKTVRNPDTYYYNPIMPGDWSTTDPLVVEYDLWSGGDNTRSTPIEKSVFDPCPSGWRVPMWLNNHSPFEGLLADDPPLIDHGRNWGKGGYFPLSGYRKTVDGAVYFVDKLAFYWTASFHPTEKDKNYKSAFHFTPIVVEAKLSTGAGSFAFPVRCCRDNL